FNCRFGDPETQPIMLRMKSDLVGLVDAALDGRLDDASCEWDERVALGVVLAAEGYPGSVRKGDAISGLENVTGAKVFHAGTTEKDGSVVTNGGRVLCVTALGTEVREAQAEAYRAISEIRWEGMFCRRDIGWRAIAREAK